MFRHGRWQVLLVCLGVCGAFACGGQPSSTSGTGSADGGGGTTADGGSGTTGGGGSGTTGGGGQTHDATSVTTGVGFTCVLRSTGAVACWGKNDHGQLGDGTTTQRLTPVAVSGLTDAVAISAGGGSACALHSDGKVSCWGDNRDGELGDGTFKDQHAPVAVSGLTDAIQVSVGVESACAVRQSGGIVCWGRGYDGQLGDNGSSGNGSGVPVDVTGISNAVHVDGGDLFNCAADGGGQALCWGENNVGQLGQATPQLYSAVPLAVPGVSGVKSVAAGDHFACELDGDGHVWCWGYAGYGELGDGGAIPSGVPGGTRAAGLVVGILDRVTAIATGPAHACALLSGGAVVCWGHDAEGELGDGSTTDSSRPVDVKVLDRGGATPLVSVDVGSGYGGADGAGRTCAVDATGAVYCWGYNANGELGDGSTTTRLTPVEVVGF